MSKEVDLWMIENVDRLVDAIAKDGCYGGPLSDPILNYMVCLEGDSRAKERARKILIHALKKKGLGNLIS